MTTTARVEIGAYLAFAIAALVGTQWALIEAIRQGDVVATIGNTLWVDPVAVFVTIDLLVTASVGLIFIAVEGRRVGVRRWPLYFAQFGWRIRMA